MSDGVVINTFTSIILLIIYLFTVDARLLTIWLIFEIILCAAITYEFQRFKKTTSSSTNLNTTYLFLNIINFLPNFINHVFKFSNCFT